MADPAAANAPVNSETSEIADLPSPSDETVALLVLVSYVLQRLLTEKRPDKAQMSVELAVVTEHLKTRFPGLFPGQ